MSRALRLRREPLTDLTPAELAAVAGGQAAPPTIDECPLSGPYPTLPVKPCLADLLDTLEATA